MKILILGTRGLLGGYLTGVLADQDIIAADRPDWDITERKTLIDSVKNCQPELIINCTAFTNVDEAEAKPEETFKVNAEGPLYLAQAAKDLNIPLVHISTDYVFDGNKQGGYNEEDPSNPINIYGKSKADGEMNIIKTWPKHYLIRTSWLFGACQDQKRQERQFINTMLRLGQAGGTIKVVNDQFSKPTYAKDLSDSIKKFLIDKPTYGIYHLINENQASWYDYAKLIFKIKKLNIKLEKISSAQFFKKAKRPVDTSLNNNKYPKLRPWSEALEDYLKKLN